jgi:hypothetical protein
MSQLKYDKPLQVSIKPSRYLRLYTGLIHLLALGVIFLPMALPIGLRLVVIAVIIVSYFRSREQQTSSYTGLLKRQDNRHWLWLDAQGNERELSFKSGAIILPRLMVLNFTLPSGKAISWSFFPDSCDEQQLRQLRIFLRYSTADTASHVV